MRTLGFGLLLWGIMFAIGSALYPWSVANRRLFESVIAVTVALVTTVVGSAYLRGLAVRSLRPALVASVTWVLSCVLLDLVVLLGTPPRFTVREYLQELGLTYLMVPVIVVGLAHQRSRAGKTGAPHPA